jgi:hypothetical protein
MRGCRFAPACVARAAGWAGAPLSGLPCVGIRPGRRGFRGFRSFEGHRALAIGPRSMSVTGGPGACTRVAPDAPAIGAPAHPAAPAFRRVDGKHSRVWERVWHRRAIEAASMPAAGALAGHRA